jgi:hypothetical protein
MLTLKEWMELADYRVTEGSDYFTNIPGLYSLSSWNEQQDGFSFFIAFDPKDNQRVYAVEACDYARNRAYRLKDPNIVLDKSAWDDVDFTDLETDDDFIQKALAIKSGEDYDDRVSVPLNLPDDALFTLMQQAHEQDITFNQHMENIVRAACEEALADPEAYKRKMGWDDEFEQGKWDEDYDADDEMDSDIQDFKPPAAMKAKKKKKK